VQCSGELRGAHLCAIEPEASQAVKHFGLQEANPAGVQLHDHCEGGVRREDDVVDHGCVITYPDMVGPVHRPRPMISEKTMGSLRRTTVVLSLWTVQSSMHALKGKTVPTCMLNPEGLRPCILECLQQYSQWQRML